MTLSEQCEREVVELHEFFEAWMGDGDAGGASADADATSADGDAEATSADADATSADGDDDPFDRVAAVIPDDFEIISPSGERRDGPTIRADVRAGRDAYADSEPPLRIVATDVRVRTRFRGGGDGNGDDGEHCLVTYEEWQRHGGDWEGRLSSALFRRRADAPNGVEWVHLHETWLPEGADPPTR